MYIFYKEWLVTKKKHMSMTYSLQSDNDRRRDAAREK